MRALLICPDEPIGVAALAECAPISNAAILGKSLVAYWLEHLANTGAKEVLLLASDRPDRVRAIVGDGTRWGLRAIVQAENRELSLAEGRAKHQDMNASASWLPPPNDIILMDHLPSLPRLPLVTSYADWFAGLRALMPHALTADRIGVKELKPAVWVGMHAHVALGAKLIPPCWIGERAWIETGAVIGPNAVLEAEVFIGRGAEVTHSAIGPKTFVGQFTEIRNSIAWGNLLVNWERDSCLKVPDQCLLCSLGPHHARPSPAKTLAKLEFGEHAGQLLTSALAEFGRTR